jgi:hypothetical protein
MTASTFRFSNILREPLVHIVVLGAALFLLDSWASSASKPVIHVSTSAQSYLVKTREDLELRTLNDIEREEIIEQYITDEILYNEAYRRGLDRGDSRMRRNLILKMRGLLAGEIDAPSEDDLRGWYEENIDQYMSSDAWIVQQIYFQDRAAIPANMLEELQAGRVEQQSEALNELRFLNSELATADRSMIFGADASQQITLIDDTHWHGPIQSQSGFHFVKIVEHRPPEPMAFDAIRPYLAGEWQLAMVNKRVSAEIETLRQDYDIVIEQ